MEDNAKVFALHVENMRNNKLKTRLSDIEAKAVLDRKKVTGQWAILFQHFVKSILNFRGFLWIEQAE